MPKKNKWNKTRNKIMYIKHEIQTSNPRKSKNFSCEILIVNQLQVLYLIKYFISVIN